MKNNISVFIILFYYRVNILSSLLIQKRNPLSVILVPLEFKKNTKEILDVLIKSYFRLSIYRNNNLKVKF